MLSSFRKNKFGIILMLVSSLCVCIGQLFWKLSASYGLGFIFIGFVVYAIGASIMLFAYKFGSLSVLQPILSTNYVLSSIMAVTILKEQMTLPKIFGIIVIIIGVIFIGGSDD